MICWSSQKPNWSEDRHKTISKLEWRLAQKAIIIEVCWSARWAPLINVPRTFKPRLHHHVEIGLTHTQIGTSPSTQATPCSTQAISFFFAMENGEQRESRGKKIEERENIRRNERQRKKKKKKSLNRQVKNNKQSGWRVYSNFSFVESYCSKMGI